MRASLVIVVGLLGIILGALLTASVSYVIAGLAGMSDFEGGRAMFAGFFMGPIGAVVGLIVGAIFGWKLGDERFADSRWVVVGLLCLLTFALVYGSFFVG